MKREIFDKEKFGFPCVIYTPEHLSDNLPVIFQLHGAGEVGNGGEEVEKVECYGFVNIFRNEELDCILVLPQCPPESFWVAEIHNIHAFIQKVAANYNADSKRVYLTGLSMGGYGTWYTALRYPQTFAAIAPICGGGMVWKAGVLDMPIWAFHGSEDDVVSPTETLNMVNALRRCGHKNVKFTMYDNVYHGSWGPAYNMELLEWLLSNHR